MFSQNELDQNINLYFFDPNREKDDFISEYKKIKLERYKREKGYRYSPLFIIQKDIRFCLGARKQFNYIPKGQFDPANFAGVILIHTAFGNLVRKFYTGNYPGFAKNFMGIHDGEHVKALDYLRNGLIHNNYSLSFHTERLKYYFLLGIGLDDMIKEVAITTNYPSKAFAIDVRRLSSAFERGAKVFKAFLLDRKNTKARIRFRDNFDVDNWLYIRESSL